MVVVALGQVGVAVEPTMKVMQYCFDGILVLRGRVIDQIFMFNGTYLSSATPHKICSPSCDANGV